MFQDLEKIQRYKGQQSNWEPPLVTGIRLFRTEMHKVLTKEAGDQAAQRSGGTQHIQQGKGDGLAPSGSGFGGQVTHKQTG